jgi:GT2 family glycosyltransferase
MGMLVSIIIPCKDEKVNVQGLLDDISAQIISFDIEIIRITDVSPASKARNMGTEKAKGAVLVFIDCDMRLGNQSVLDNIVRPLQDDRSIGSVCPSILIPTEASEFQVRYAREVPHCEVPVVDKLTDIGLATTGCWAIRRDVFVQLGGFNEHIIRGEDSELAVRLKKAGYRIVLAPHTWCFHPSPDNIRQLIKTNLRNGIGVAFVDMFYPDLNVDVHAQGILYSSERKTVPGRIKRFLLQGIEATLRMKIIFLASKLFYALGYYYGFLKYRIVKKKN